MYAVGSFYYLTTCTVHVHVCNKRDNGQLYSVYDWPFCQKYKGLAPVFLDSRLEHPVGWICARYKSSVLLLYYDNQG